MPQTVMQTINCPKCGAQLPAWAQNCQFCNTALGNVARPAGVKMHAGFDSRMSWQEVAYIVVSILLVITGAYDFLKGVIWVSNEQGGAFIGILGAIRAFLGAGMLAQQSWAQFLMKWISYLNIVVGLFILLQGLIFMGGKSDLAHTIGIGYILYALFEVGLFGFTMYLINVVGDV